MNYVGEKEAEKTKEAKKAPSADSYSPYENEAAEGYEESLGPETLSRSEDDLFAPPCPPPGGSGTADDRERVGEDDSWEKRQRKLLQEKWLSVTGRKPRNVPTVKRRQEEESAFVHFGDRRPLEVDQILRENWLQAARKMKTLVPNFGKVHKEVLLPALSQGMLCIRFDRYGKTLTTSCRNGTAQVRRASDGEVLQVLPTMESLYRLPVRTVQYSPINDDLVLLAGGKGVVQAFSISTGGCLLRSYAKLPQLNIMDFTADGNNLVVAGLIGTIGILDPGTLQLKSKREWPMLTSGTVPTIEDEFHKMKIYGLRCHPTYPDIFITGSLDETVKIWDVREQAAIRSIRGPFICGNAIDVVGNTIVTASWRVSNSLQLWDFPSGKLIKGIPIQTKSTVFEGEFLYAAKFFSDVPNSLLSSDCVATGGNGFSSTLVINTATGKTIAAFPAYKAVLAIDVWNSSIAYGGKESTFRLGEVVISESKQKKIK